MSSGIKYCNELIISLLFASFVDLVFHYIEIT